MRSRDLPRPPCDLPGYGETITPGPYHDPALDPMANARNFVAWARTLPGRCRAGEWRRSAATGPQRPGPGSSGVGVRTATKTSRTVRVYMHWNLDGRWMTSAKSFVQFHHGPLAFVHSGARRGLRPPMAEADETALEAIRAWVARNGGAGG